jgi:DinB family protein
MLRVLLVALPLAALAVAQTTAEAPPNRPLTQHERDYAMSAMHASRKLFLDAVAGLTPEQWNFKPAPDRWSIAECAEHIAVSEDFIAGMIRDRIMKGPVAPEKRSEVKVTDEQIVQMVPERTQKFKAPEPIVPTHRWADPSETVAHFKESRDRNIAYIETTQEDLRDHFGPHPAFGMLDAYQWMLLISGHTERHTNQILEVKADPKYPK